MEMTVLEIRKAIKAQKPTTKVFFSQEGLSLNPIPPRKPGRRKGQNFNVTLVDYQEACLMRETGSSYQEIGEKFNTSKQNAYLFMKRRASQVRSHTQSSNVSESAP